MQTRVGSIFVDLITQPKKGRDGNNFEKKSYESCTARESWKKDTGSRNKKNYKGEGGYCYRGYMS